MAQHKFPNESLKLYNSVTKYNNNLLRFSFKFHIILDFFFRPKCYFRIPKTKMERICLHWAESDICETFWSRRTDSKRRIQVFGKNQLKNKTANGEKKKSKRNVCLRNVLDYKKIKQKNKIEEPEWPRQQWRRREQNTKRQTLCNP